MGNSEDYKSASEDFFNRLKKAVKDLENKAVLFKIHANMLEEELVAVLDEIDPQEADLEFFTNLGTKFYNIEAWELLNVIKTHIEYNFNVEITTKKGISKYEEIKKY